MPPYRAAGRGKGGKSLPVLYGQDRWLRNMLLKKERRTGCKNLLSLIVAGWPVVGYYKNIQSGGSGVRPVKSTAVPRHKNRDRSRMKGCIPGGESDGKLFSV